MKLPGDPGALWAALARDAREELATVRVGRPRAGREARDVGEREQRAVALLASADGRADAEAHGALAALLVGRHRERLVPFWLALGGPGFAIACATRERRLVAAYPRVGGKLDLGTRWLEERDDARVPVALDTTTWETLHAAFRKLTKAEKAAAREEVRAARAGAPVGVALWASTAALLGEEAAEDVRALPEDIPPEMDTWLIAALSALAAEPSDRTREVAIEILEGAAPSALSHIARHPKELVSLLGEADVDVLVALLAEAHHADVVDATAVKKVAEALAASEVREAEAVGDFFRKNVQSRLVGTVAAAWVVAREADPRAAEVHARAVAEKAVRSKRAKKIASAKSALGKREAVVATAREASEDEIPWVLRHPPWTIAGTPPVPDVACGAGEDDFEERLHLSESDREGIDDTVVVDDDDPVGLLAQQGLAALPKLLAQPITEVIRGLCRVESPRVAARMLDALGTRRAEIARAHFRAYPRASAIGLVRVALDSGSPTRKRKEALEAIGVLLEEGHEDDVREAASGFGADTVGALVAAAEVAARPVEEPVVPPWAREAALPSVLVPSGARLPEAASRNLVALCTLGAHPALRGLSLDRVSTDRFLVALLEAWIRRGRHAGEPWVLSAAAALGGPDAARAVAQAAKEWNRERGTRDLALAAVQALGEGGSGAALALTELARKGGALGERAGEVLAEVARREHLSPEELADLTVPTLDLDERGRAALDFGSRRFEVVLGEDLAPAILDDAGRPVKTVRALKSDDPAKAQASLDRLKSLKKSMGEVARTVAARLELGMVLRRTWRAATFQRALVEHPIVGRIVRRLLWSRAGGRLFRVAEDGTAADADDALVELADGEIVLLPHVLDLSPDQQRAWGQIFGDYEILEPFPQLARPTFTPTDAERAAGALSRFHGHPAKQMAIQGRLLSRGWERVADGGVTSAYIRRFRAITAHYTLVDRLGFGEEFSNETTLGAVTFGVPLDGVPPRVFSEVAYDVHVLAQE